MKGVREQKCVVLWDQSETECVSDSQSKVQGPPVVCEMPAGVIKNISSDEIFMHLFAPVVCSCLPAALMCDAHMNFAGVLLPV